MAGCCKKKEGWLHALVMVAVLLVCWLSYNGICNAQQLPSATGLSEGEFRTLIQQLRESGYYSAATVLNFVTRQSMVKSVTLLVPTDPSLAKIATIAPSDYSSLLKCHVLASNLRMKRLQLLPVNTWIPTLLPGYGVEVTSNSPNNYSLNGIQIVNADLCPSLAPAQIACHGIDSILNPASQLGIQPPEFAQFSSPPNPSTITQVPPASSPINPPNFASVPPVAPTPLFAFLAPLKSPSPTVPSPSPTSAPTPPPSTPPTPAPTKTQNTPTPTPAAQTPAPTPNAVFADQTPPSPVPSLGPASPPTTAPEFAEAQTPPAPPADSTPSPVGNPNASPFTTSPLFLHLTISISFLVFSLLHPSFCY